MKEFEQKVKDGEEKAASLGPELVEKVLECAKLKEAKNKKATAVEHLNEAAKGTYSETGPATLGESMRRGVIPAFAGKQRYRQGGWDCAHGCLGVHFNPKDVECEDQISQVPQPTQAVGEALAILAKKTNVVDPKKEPALKKKATGQ